MKGREPIVLFLVALLGAVAGHPVAARDQADAFEELAGTWIRCEYDGLFPRCEELTWLADGSLSFCDSQEGQPGGRRSFAVVEKWTDPDWGVHLRAVEVAGAGSGTERSCLLIRISRGGNRLEKVENPFPVFPARIDAAAPGYRCYFRKKIYRRWPRHRLDDRDQLTRLV